MKHTPPPTGEPVTLENRPRRPRAGKAESPQALSKLRQKASTEIDRLLAFLDACDPYVTTELEENARTKPPNARARASSATTRARKAITSRAWAASTTTIANTNGRPAIAATGSKTLPNPALAILTAGRQVGAQDWQDRGMV